LRAQGLTTADQVIDYINVTSANNLSCPYQR